MTVKKQRLLTDCCGQKERETSIACTDGQRRYFCKQSFNENEQEAKLSLG